jgi:hypothetical protein
MSAKHYTFPPSKCNCSERAARFRNSDFKSAGVDEHPRADGRGRLSFAACSILDSVVSIFPSYELRVTSSRVTSFFPTILPTTRYGFTLLRSKERYSMRAFVIQELAS